VKQCWPAPERNRDPILEVLKGVLPEQGQLLEIASGSGQHAVYFAEHLHRWKIQPSDIDPDNLESIRAWVNDSGLANLLAPLELDVLEVEWPAPQVAAVFCANMIHIAPWECTLGLMRNVSQHLVDEGLLITYGPYQIDGRHTAPSNLSFDAGLKSQNPSWGVRNLNDVVDVAASFGLSYSHRVPMPANNFIIIFKKG
jgi:cyclopropane fatty-acyl-phospholipid synthase-like methyltransferase